MMYRFNALLFKLLPDVLSLKKKHFLELNDLSAQSYRRWASQEDVPLSVLVDICNTMHISISHFITTESTQFIDSKSNMEINEGEFVAIQLHLDRLSDLFGQDKAMKITVKEVASTMEVSIPTYLAWTAEGNETKIWLSVFLRLCNHYRLNAGEFVTDINKPITKAFSSNFISTNAYEKELKKMEQTNWELKRENELLKKEIEEMKKQFCTGYSMNVADNECPPYGNHKEEEK